MKIPKEMWASIIFCMRVLPEPHPCSKLDKLIKVANLKEFFYMDKQYPYIDTIWDIGQALQEIDIEKNKPLKDLFFQEFIQLSPEEKTRLFKNKDSEEKYFTKELKKYYVKEMIKTPTVWDLYKFKKEINQQQLQEGLKNFFEQLKYVKINNLPKEEYWENILGSKNSGSLIDLLEIAQLSGDTLKEWQKIGFINDDRQYRFDKLINPQKTQLKLIDEEEGQMFFIKLKIHRPFILDNFSDINAQSSKNLEELIKIMFKEGLGLDVFEKENKNAEDYQTVVFFTKDENIYQHAQQIKQILINWLPHNLDTLLKTIDKKYSTNALELKEQAQEILKRLLLSVQLENTLDVKEKTINKFKI